MAAALLIIETIIALAGFFYTFKRDRLFGVYFAFLFLYAIFGQIGYYYFSELSELIGAYFGENPWYTATYLIISSLTLTIIIFALTWNKIIKAIPFRLTLHLSRTRTWAMIAFFALGLIITFELSYFAFNYNNINWDTVQDEDFVSKEIYFAAFIFIFKQLVAIVYVLYCIIRLNNSMFSRFITKSIFFASLGIFLFIAFRMGNRTDLLALALGIAIFEFYRIKFNLKVLLKLTISCVVVFLFLTLVESLRYKDGGLDLTPNAAIIMKDYFAPIHMLFAAASFSYIDPAEVLLSNISNSLIMIGYPYLQYTITEIFRPGIASRSAGYAFYIFTEGYLFMGPIGFIYNSIVVVVGLALWRRLGTTNDKNFNLFVLGLMGCMLVNMVRGQSSYFIKYIYMFGVPGILLYTTLVGQRVSFNLGWRAKLLRSAG